MDQGQPQVTTGEPRAVDESENGTVPPKAGRVQLTGGASDRETLRLGRRAFERGDDATATRHFDRLLAHGVRFADVHYMLGMICERRGDLDGALTQLRESVRLNPSYAEALLALASLHERRGEYDRSQGYAERASRLARPAAGGLDPTTRGKLANQQAALGDALADAGERRAAIEQYRGALERCPTFHDIRHRLAIALRDAGLPAQAATEFQRILRLHPALLDSQIQLGLTWYTMGRTAEAIAEWNAVLEKDPGRDEARMYLRLVSGRQRSAGDVAPSVTPMTPAAADEPELSFTAVGAAEPPPEPATSGWKKTNLAGERRG